MNKRLALVLSAVFGLRSDEIRVELSKDEIGSWDSLKQMDLVVSLEKEFNIALEIPDIIKMNSVGQIVDVLAAKGVDFGD